MTTTTSKQLAMHLAMDEKINKEALHKLHKESMLSADYKISQQDTAQIIHALGGIKAVLEVCLESKELKLADTNNLNTLHQIITDSNKRVNITDINKEDCVEFEYTFDENNTFLHSLLGPIKTQKIQKLVEHKIIIALFALGIIITFILMYVSGASQLVTNIWNITIWSIFIPWFISKHTLFNKKAFKLCLKSFDYWIKIVYAIMYAIWDFLYVYPPGHRSVLGIITYCFGCVGMFLFMSFFASFDAFVMGKKKKLIMSAFAALFFTLLAIRYQFLASDESDYKMEIELNEGIHIISVISLLSHSTKILSIFLWKQTINTFRREGKAVSLTVVPAIKWIKKSIELCEEKDEDYNADI